MSQSADWLAEWAERPQHYDLLVLLPNLGRGGAQRVASLLIDAWAEQGYRICVATFSDKTEDAHRLDERVTRLKVREFLRIRTGKAPKVAKLPPPVTATIVESLPPLAAEEPPVAVAPVVEAAAGPIAIAAPCVAEPAVAEMPRIIEPVAPPAAVELVPVVETVSPPVVEPAPVVASPWPGDSDKPVDGSLIEILRTVKRTVRRRLRVALFPVREAGRALRRRARDARRIGREARRLSREARRMSREARRKLRAAGREAQREVRAVARGAHKGLRTVARDAERGVISAKRDAGKSMGRYLASAMGVLDWLAPATDRLHFRGAVQCLRALRGTARDAGLAQWAAFRYGDLLTDRAKCRQVLAARLLMEHVQAPVTLAFLGATNIVAALARHGLPTRLVISERNDPALQALQPVWQELRPLMYRGADVVTANSRGAVATMTQWMPASRLAHVPNPLRVPADPGTRRLRAGPCFISVGRLVPQKRVDLVIEAFAGLDGVEGWALEILGDGPERMALGDLVASRGVNGRVRFHGHVDPFPHLYAADVFVLASDFEGMPNALLEAMACGVVPIVNDATPGPLEFVEHDRTGLVVPAGDCDALAAAMRELACDELRRARLAAAARERMGDLAFDHVLDIWSDVLRLPALAAAAASAPRLARLAR